MKLSLLVSTAQLNSSIGRSLGAGTDDGLRHLAELMKQCGIDGDIFDLPNGSCRPDTASPFSLTSGFAMNHFNLNVFSIPELNGNKSLSSTLQQIHKTYQKEFESSRRVSYTLKRTIMPWVLEGCYEVFCEQEYRHREEQFEIFLEAAKFWIDDYALYEVIREEGLDAKDVNLAEFKSTHSERIKFHKYIQLLCFQQRTQLVEDLRKKGVGLIVNLPFGVEMDSADVFFHPEVFDATFQVGCSPEPEHGYPEQAWGVAAYRENTTGLEQYLKERMNWLSQLGDGIFIDHLVGWCGQYVVPIEIPTDSIYPHGHFLTEDREKRIENILWFFNIIKATNLQIKGEIAGDYDRVEATRAALKKMKQYGYDVRSMAIPRWEFSEGQVRPLQRYETSTLTMIETHDTSTLVQYLLNQKGNREDFEDPVNILNFCQRVLGLPFCQKDIPLQLEEMTDPFCFEIANRLTNGSPTEETVFTISGLMSLLSSKYRSSSLTNNINVQPGTPGLIDNEWNNWSFFSPPIDDMVDDNRLQIRIQRLVNAAYQSFDYFHLPDYTAKVPSQFHICFSKIGNRKILHRSENGWDLWQGSAERPLESAVLELVIYNPEKEELWDKIDVSDWLDLTSPNTSFDFQDLNNEQPCYSYGAHQLLTEKLFIKLKPKQVHHFLVFKN